MPDERPTRTRAPRTKQPAAPPDEADLWEGWLRCGACGRRFKGPPEICPFCTLDNTGVRPLSEIYERRAPEDDP